ncbi:hypothetical protein SAMN04488095_1022 [Jannaschia pohangensis]|uniref:Uncharacterized protein n=1 Tax=Jannaschia pohangensis TaxID=390807 RepID=A0A1I3ILF0_9RHOB|nr:hypothetical protein SAMN04488095_1022 [Jannaschia pohangensis]
MDMDGAVTPAGSEATADDSRATADDRAFDAAAIFDDFTGHTAEARPDAAPYEVTLGDAARQGADHEKSGKDELAMH